MRFAVDPADPHAGQPVLTSGPKPVDARLTIILVHGRGASADDKFLAPIPQNEPGISSGLAVLSRMIESLHDQGVDSQRIGLLGCSQGACLALEFAGRHARRYAGVFALSGGLIGPPGTPRNYPGSFAGTAVFLGCGDADPHIPGPHASIDLRTHLVPPAVASLAAGTAVRLRESSPINEKAPSFEHAKIDARRSSWSTASATSGATLNNRVA